MTQYIADLIRKLQANIKEIYEILDTIVAPENADYVYIDKTRGGLDEHDTPIPPVDEENNEGNDSP